MHTLTNIICICIKTKPNKMVILMTYRSETKPKFFIIYVLYMLFSLLFSREI